MRVINTQLINQIDNYFKATRIERTDKNFEIESNLKQKIYPK